MDKLDKMMFNLPKADQPTGLSDRLQQNFTKRYQKKQRLMMTMTTIPSILGILLIIPGFHQLYQLISQLENNWQEIKASLSWFFSGNLQFDSLWYLSNFRWDMATSLEITTWIGLILLAIGAAVGLNSWLTNTLREA